MSVFSFKKFDIQQDKAAMKVGTDAVVLGAFSDISNQPQTILDVGAGTGIIALMLAQRSGAEIIDAIEIDEAAYLECVENFENSPWGDRLFCYHGDFAELVEDSDYGYDLIISNPPFYLNQHFAETESRTTARFADKLQPEFFFACAANLLTETGTVQIIVPEADYQVWVNAAKKAELQLQHRKIIYPMPGKAAKRTVLQFGFYAVAVTESELTVEKSRGNYTAQYREATKDFHPKF
ncbi:tRNA1(Val) (adenine(37)-N6)-methyltransferase [Flavobacterium sp.]|uniref:tRNA1(Val) (adenine(37)-N6)-methyltransferase n=1 Tax=Flavobacterium sp. TaxID=239 RepID=UPI003B9D2453